MTKDTAASITYCCRNSHGEELGKRMTTRCSIVSVPEKAGGKPNTRKREWTKARKLRGIVLCTIQ